LDPSILIAAALWEGLMFVGKKLAEEILIVGFEPAKDWLKTKILEKYKDAPENSRLADIVRTSLNQCGAPVEDEDQLLAWCVYSLKETMSCAGRHKEIYMGDPHRAAPKKLKTVLRQPV
jgi:hypothetical protein